MDGSSNPLLVAALQWQLDPLKGSSNWASWELHIQTPLNMLNIAFALTKYLDDPIKEDNIQAYEALNAANRKTLNREYEDWKTANGLCILLLNKHTTDHIRNNIAHFRYAKDV